MAAEGRVITFYSFKGGVGRTMALANVAWILAANGKRVAVLDWDLEAPGLHRYFPPSVLDPEMIGVTRGVIDMIRDFESAAARHPGVEPDRWYRDNTTMRDMAVQLRWDFPDRGHIHFVGAGLMNRAYSTAVASLDWDRFYSDLGGGLLIDALRQDLRENYDYALIDSRTGFSDVADICTAHLPDVLVDCFTLSNQSIEGAARVAHAIAAYQESGRSIRVLPVPLRIDEGEKEKADSGRALARLRFNGLPEVADTVEADRYWDAVEVPYRPFYAYEETLAVFGDAPGQPASLLSAYERLTGEITEGAVTSMPPMAEARRLSTLEQLIRNKLF